RDGSDASRSRNIATLRRDGYPPKQAAAIAYKIQRNAMSTKLARRSRRARRAHRNPTSRIKWKRVAVGAGAGAAVGVGAGYVIQGANNAPLPTPMTSVSNAITGAGVGALLVGLLSLFSKRGVATGVAGAAVGALALSGAFLMSTNP